MTFLMLLSIIVLSMLMIPLFTSRVVRCMLCGNNWIWLLNLNLTYEAVWIRVWCDLLFSMLGKLSLFCLIALITGAIDVKLNPAVPEEKSSWSCGDLISLLERIGGLTLSLLLKIPSRNWELFVSPFLDVNRRSVSTILFLTLVDSEILCRQIAFLWLMI